MMQKVNKKAEINVNVSPTLWTVMHVCSKSRSRIRHKVVQCCTDNGDLDDKRKNNRYSLYCITEKGKIKITTSLILLREIISAYFAQNAVQSTYGQLFMILRTFLWLLLFFSVISDSFWCFTNIRNFGGKAQNTHISILMATD